MKESLQHYLENGMALRLPIGKSDFKKLREGGYYYSDKTLFIDELLRIGGEVTLIPRPRRFGKTLNLSMLKYFFEKTDASNAHLFEGTAIWKREKYRKLQGTFRVIYISLTSCQSSSWKTVYNSMVIVISREFSRHFKEV